jgi:hypothetical protein
MINQWREGNEFLLLENGERYFPRVLEAVGEARVEILLETFILFDDKVGQALRAALIAAATRGVQVDVTVDGYGSDDLSPQFISGMTDCGVRFHVFDPRPRILGMRTNLFRRMHRKLISIDGRVAFVGGINFSADHLQVPITCRTSDPRPNRTIPWKSTARWSPTSVSMHGMCSARPAPRLAGDCGAGYSGKRRPQAMRTADWSCATTASTARTSSAPIARGSAWHAPTSLSQTRTFSRATACCAIWRGRLAAAFACG